MQLTPHFTLEELCFSQEAVRTGLDNTPPTDVVASRAWLAPSPT